MSTMVELNIDTTHPCLVLLRRQNGANNNCQKQDSTYSLLSTQFLVAGAIKAHVLSNQRSVFGVGGGGDIAPPQHSHFYIYVSDNYRTEANLGRLPVTHITPQPSLIEHLHMMSQHSNSLATATAANLVHNENLLRLNQNGRHFHGKRMHTNGLLVCMCHVSALHCTPVP